MGTLQERNKLLGNIIYFSAINSKIELIPDGYWIWNILSGKSSCADPKKTGLTFPWCYSAQIQTAWGNSCKILFISLYLGFFVLQMCLIMTSNLGLVREIEQTGIFFFSTPRVRRQCFMARGIRVPESYASWEQDAPCASESYLCL